MAPEALLLPEIYSEGVSLEIGPHVRSRGRSASKAVVFGHRGGAWKRLLLEAPICQIKENLTHLSCALLLQTASLQMIHWMYPLSSLLRLFVRHIPGLGQHMSDRPIPGLRRGPVKEHLRNSPNQRCRSELQWCPLLEPASLFLSLWRPAEKSR